MKYIMLILFTYLFSILSACSKPNPTEKPRNPNIEYIEFNSQLNKSGAISVDIDHDSKNDISIWFDINKDVDYFESTAAIAVPNHREILFDVIYDTLSKNKYPVVLNTPLGFNVNNSYTNWYSKINTLGSIEIFNYKHLIDSNKEVGEGLYNVNFAYIPFRFYTTMYGNGWINAWMYLKITHETIELVSVAYYKELEKEIKIGEK